MIPLPFDTISWDDIEALVTSGRPEDRSLEYKEELPGNSDDEKREFLADLSALVNTAGGDLIYGIAEQRDQQNNTTGIPDTIPGVSAVSMDPEIRRLENLHRDSVEPRVLGIRMKELQAQDGRKVLLVRAPASLVGPHVVRIKNHWRFYGRCSTGKYPLDIGEVRSAFAASEELPERLRRFRAERLLHIAGNEAPLRLKEGPKVVLHLVPLAAMNRLDSPHIDLHPDRILQFVPLRTHYIWHRLNIDGGIVYTANAEGAPWLGYCQVFRNGIIEVVGADMFDPLPNSTTPRLAVNEVEVALIERTRAYLRRMRDDLGLQPPLYVMLSLIGVRDIEFLTYNSFSLGRLTVDRDIVQIPEEYIESFDLDPADWYRNIFDALWQSAGYEGSPNYGPEGKRK